MALSITVSPRESVGGTPPFDSYAIATTQIRFVFNEDAITGKDNYYLKILIPEADNIELFYFPDTSDNMDFDLGKILYQYMIKDGITHLKFRINYSAFWDGGSYAAINDIYYLAVKADRQILSPFGANLYYYSLKDVVGDSLSDTTPGRFLTHFNSYYIWDGWTTYFDIINNEFLGSYGQTRRVLDINRNVLSSTPSTFLVPETYDIRTNSITYPATANAAYMDITYDNGTNDISETKEFKLMDECKNPIMLQWDGQLGATEQYLFQYEQNVSENSEQGFLYEMPITSDISTITGTKFRQPGKYFQVMTLKAFNLTQNELQSLHYIKQSSRVKVWLDKDGSNFVEVIVNSGYTTAFTTGKSNYEFTINIEFPSGFDFFKAKAY
jgi:hypothetical protein